MTRPGIEPRSPGPLVNTLTTRPMSGTIYIERVRGTVGICSGHLDIFCTSILDREGISSCKDKLVRK